MSFSDFHALQVSQNISRPLLLDHLTLTQQNNGIPPEELILKNFHICIFSYLTIFDTLILERIELGNRKHAYHLEKTSAAYMYVYIYIIVVCACIIVNHQHIPTRYILGDIELGRYPRNTCQGETAPNL